MMNANTVKILSANRPPPILFSNVKDADVEIRRIETLLSKPPGRKILNLVKANDRVRELRSELELLSAVKATVAASTPTITLPTLAWLAACHIAVFGDPETERFIQNWEAFEVGGGKVKAAKADAEQVRRRFGCNTPAAAIAARKVAEASIQQRKEQAGSDSEKFERLAASFHNAGLRVPGLPRRVSVSEKKSLFTNAAQPLSGRELELAQRALDRFCQLTGNAIDPVAISETHPVAKAARDYLTRCGRIDGCGNLKL